MAALFAAHLLFIKSDNFFRPAGVSRLPVWAALNVQPIAAEDWPVVVVWLGCGFSGRHRESASEYRVILRVHRRNPAIKSSTQREPNEKRKRRTDTFALRS